MGRRSDHSREQLTAMALDAAEARIESGGLNNLTARKVAGDIGYTVGSLYLIFENIDDLVDQINMRTLNELYDRAVHAVQVTASPQGNLLALGDVYLDYAFAHSNRWRTVFDHRRGAEARSRQKRARYVRRISRLFALVRQELKRIDESRSEAEIATNALALWSGVHGVIALALDDKLGFAGETAARHIATTLVTRHVAGYELGNLS